MFFFYVNRFFPHKLPSPPQLPSLSNSLVVTDIPFPLHAGGPASSVAFLLRENTDTLVNISPSIEKYDSETRGKYIVRLKEGVDIIIRINGQVTQ